MKEAIIGLYEFFGVTLQKFTLDITLKVLKEYEAEQVKNAVMQIVTNFKKFPQNPLAEIIDIIDPIISPELFIADMFERKRKGHAGFFTVKQKAFYKSLGCTWDGLDSFNRTELKFHAKEFLGGIRKSQDEEQDESQHRLIEQESHEIEAGGIKLLNNLNLKLERI